MSEHDERYDAGLLPEGDHDQDWWQTAMRHELDRAHEFYAQAIERLERERQEMIVERDDCLEELAEVRARDEKELARKVTSEALGDTARERDKETDLAEKAERELEIVTASLTDQETENGRLREQLADARAREDDRQEAIRAVLKVLSTQREPHPDDDLQKIVNLACSLLDDALTDYVPEALAAPAPMDELQRLGQEYDAAPHIFKSTSPIRDKCEICGQHPCAPVHKPAPSTGEAERLKALGNAEQIAANRAANTTDPREAAVASRIANDIKQLRE